MTEYALMSTMYYLVQFYLRMSIRLQVWFSSQLQSVYHLEGVYWATCCTCAPIIAHFWFHMPMQMPICFVLIAANAMCLVVCMFCAQNKIRFTGSGLPIDNLINHFCFAKFKAEYSKELLRTFISSSHPSKMQTPKPIVIIFKMNNSHRVPAFNHQSSAKI